MHFYRDGQPLRPFKRSWLQEHQKYNEKFIKRKLNPQKGHQFLPFIVLVIDEFADLIMTAGKD